MVSWTVVGIRGAGLSGTFALAGRHHFGLSHADTDRHVPTAHQTDGATVVDRTEPWSTVARQSKDGGALGNLFLCCLAPVLICALISENWGG